METGSETGFIPKYATRYDRPDASCMVEVFGGYYLNYMSGRYAAIIKPLWQAEQVWEVMHPAN